MADEIAEVMNEFPGWVKDMGIVILTATPEQVTCEWEVSGKHHQPYGIVHGGVHCGVVETLASIGAALVAKPRGQHVVGLENTLCALLLAGAASLLSATPAAAAWYTLGGNAAHTGLSPTAAQPLETIRWSTPVDLAPPTTGSILIHFGSPLITPANTVLIPVKTGASGGYRVDARAGATGALIWSAVTDYVLPAHTWIPSYAPVLTTSNRIYYPGAGGTVLFRDNVDQAVANNSGRLAFFGIAAYNADTANFNSTVFINTPITADAAGNIYFGFRIGGTPPLGLKNGIARIDTAGNGTWIATETLTGGDAGSRVPHQAAPALSADEQTLYVVVAGATPYLMGLDTATLALKEAQPGVPMRVALKDPRNNSVNNANVSDNSSSTPMVGPDGDVYFGVLGNPGNGSRGWLLHFSGNLTQTKIPGGFGWDTTPAVVPAAAVPSYTGTSSYLVFTKYNNYPGFDGGDGVNKIAVLDPNDTMVEPHASSAGLLVMKSILSIAGPTPDPNYYAAYPNAVREWCINAGAVDPITKSVMANSEDGKLYRWDLTTNTLSQAVVLSPGIGEAYTTTLIGPDGTVYATNWAILNAVGRGVGALSSAKSRKVHGNPGTTFDLQLAATPLAPTTEPRSAAAGGAHSLVFTFDKAVTGGNAAVTEGTAIPGTPTFSGNEMIVPLSGVADAQFVTVAVTGIVTADGGTGSDASVRVGFLAGDANQSRTVTPSDLVFVNNALAQPVSGANFLRDVNVSGTLTPTDLLFVNANQTHALPAP